MEILALAEGLTLAQFGPEERPRTLVVFADDGHSVRGIDLSASLEMYPDNPLDLARRVRWEELEAQRGQAMVEVAYEALLAPGRWTPTHVAAGANYEAHAEESSIEGGGFLFPKRAVPGPAVAEVPWDAGMLLDYEVELGVMFGDDLSPGDPLESVTIGFVVCNDFTDRAILAREADRDNIQSGKGFPDAKGFPGAFQTGPYIVVPHDWEQFFARLRIGLRVNGSERQEAAVNEMNADIRELLAQTFSHGAEAKWTHNGKAVPLLEDGVFRKGTILLTGTPAGVVFAPPGKGFLARAAVGGILTLDAFRRGFGQSVVERFVARELSSKRYLQPGDVVEAYGTYLGYCRAVVRSEKQ